MNKRTKLLLLLSTMLVVSIALSGCFANKDKIDQDIDLQGEDNQVDEDIDQDEEPSIDDENLDLTRLPGFKLKDIEGNDISSDVFNDYEMTVVPIWQSTCGPCIGELDALNTVYDKYRDQGVNVLGISLDNVDAMGDEGVKNVVETLELEYTNLIADNDYLMKLIDYVQGTPTAFIIGKDGEILIGPRVGSNGKEQDIEDFSNMIEDIIGR